MVFEVFRRQRRAMMAVLAIAAMGAFVLSDFYYRYNRGSSGQDGEVGEVWGRKVQVSEIQKWQAERHHLNRFFHVAMNTVGAKSRPPFWSSDINAILQSMALVGKAEQLGVIVSNDDVSTFINAYTENKLSKQDFATIIAGRHPSGEGESGVNTSAGDLFEGLRRELKIEQLIRLTASTVDLQTPLQMWERREPTLTHVKLQTVRVGARKFADQVDKPTEEELTKLFEAHKEQTGDATTGVVGFKSPRKVGLEYLMAKADDLLDTVTVTDDEIKAYYESHKDDFKKAPEVEPAPPMIPGVTPAPEKKSDEAKSKSAPKEDAKTDPPAKKDEKPTAKPKEAANPAAEKKEAPKSDEPAKEAPKPTEAKKTDDKPAESKPAETKEKPVDNKEDKPKEMGLLPRWTSSLLLTAAAAEDEKKSDEKKADAPKAEVKKVEEPKAEPAKAAGEPKKVDEKKAEGKEAEEKKPADAPTAVEKKPEEKKADAKPESVGPPAPPAAVKEEAPAKPIYKTLDEVKDEIRKSIQREKVGKKIIDQMNEIREKTMYAYLDTEYKPSLAKYKQSSPEAASDLTKFTPPKSPDLAAIAKEQRYVHAAVEPTGDLGTLPLATARCQDEGTQYQGRLLGDLAFGQPIGGDLYRGRVMKDASANTYFLYWKTADVPARTPTFAEVKDEVEFAWKLDKAKEKAKAFAEDLAERIRKEMGDVEKVLEKESDLTFKTTAFFSRYTRQAAFGQMGMMPPNVPELQNVDGKFYDEVFKLKLDEIAVLPDATSGQYYIVKVKERDEAKYEDFIAEYGFETRFSQFSAGNTVQLGIQETILGIAEEAKIKNYYEENRKQAPNAETPSESDAQ